MNRTQSDPACKTQERKFSWIDPDLLEYHPAQPLAKAPFTLKEIKAAIPEELFEANLWKSFYYIGRDFVQLAVGSLLVYWALQFTENAWMRAVIWMLHWAVQGTTCFGIWVIAHECGHQSYFGVQRKNLNLIFGFALHTALLVPYHAWRITHATHHRYTNLIPKDTAFPSLEQPSMFWKAIKRFQPLMVLCMSTHIIFGWPFYLILNKGGRENFGEKYPHVNHFDPSAPYFQPSDRNDILASDAGLVVVIGVLGWFASQFGLNNVLLWYGGVWLVCHMWLVVVTFLQHQHPSVPHYSRLEDFDFVRGALSTVDRDYGHIINVMLHHITDGHLLHHLFSTMPFYHAIEATPHVKRLLGTHYHYDNRNLFVQMWGAWHTYLSSFMRMPDQRK